MRSGDYKLIHFFEDAHVELYNLRTDQGETQDLAVRKPTLAGKLRGMLSDWQEKVEAKIPQPNPDWIT